MIKIGKNAFYLLFILGFSLDLHADNFETVFIENEIDTSQLYIGQPFLLKTYVTHKGNIKSMDLIETDISQGSSIEDVTLAPHISKKSTQILKNGFFKQQVFTKIVTPFRLGNFSIEGSTFRVEFQSSPGLYKIISPNKVFYTVLSTPDSGFRSEGTIGNISIQTKISPTHQKIELGQSIQLTLDITTSNGGVKLMKLPTLQKSKDYTINIKESSHNYFLNSDVISSHKKITLLFIPHKSGEVIFPALQIFSFLPKNKKYKSYKIPEFPIQVSSFSGEESYNPKKLEENFSTTDMTYWKSKEIVYSILSPGIVKKILWPISIFLFVAAFLLLSISQLTTIYLSYRSKNLYFFQTHNMETMDAITHLEKQIQSFFQKRLSLDPKNCLFTKEIYSAPSLELQKILLSCQKIKYQKGISNISQQEIQSLFQKANLVAKKMDIYYSL